MDTRAKIYAEVAAKNGVSIFDVKECANSEIDLLLESSRTRTPVRLPLFGVFRCKVPLEGRTYSKQQQKLIDEQIRIKAENQR